MPHFSLRLMFLHWLLHYFLHPRLTPRWPRPISRSLGRCMEQTVECWWCFWYGTNLLILVVGVDTVQQGERVLSWHSCSATQNWIHSLHTLLLFLYSCILEFLFSWIILKFEKLVFFQTHFQLHLLLNMLCVQGAVSTLYWIFLQDFTNLLWLLLMFIVYV